jgi:hypothetical protein
MNRRNPTVKITIIIAKTRRKISPALKEVSQFDQSFEHEFPKQHPESHVKYCFVLLLKIWEHS